MLHFGCFTAHDCEDERDTAVIHSGECRRRSGRIYDEAGRIEDFDDQNDFGDGTSGTFTGCYNVRIVTFTPLDGGRYGCTCMYCHAFGGLPCRHLLFHCIASGVSTFPTHRIQDKWLKHDQASLKTMRVRMQTAPKYVPVRPLASSRATTLTRSDRYKILMSEARDIAHLACEDRADFDSALHALKECMRLLQVQAQPPPLQREQAAPAPAPAAASGAPGGDADAEDDEEESSSIEFAPRDEESYRQVMGISFEPDNTSITARQMKDFTFLRTLVERWVVVKWFAK